MNIVKLVEDFKLQQAKRFPTYTNRASEIGHPCLRYLVFCRTNWKDRNIPNIDKLLIFGEGNLQEDKVIRDLNEVGIKVWEQGLCFGDEEFFKTHQISGSIDGKIEVDKTRLPLEIKSMSPYIFQSINSLEDMTNSKNYWLKKYPAQISLYMLGSNVDRGIFLLKNKSNGKLKQIDVNLDYQFAEELIKKADLLNDYIAKKTLPEPIDDDKICSQCDFSHICCPDRDFGKTLFFDVPEIKTMLDRREEILPLIGELEEIKKALQQFTGTPDVLICEDYRLTGKWIERKEFFVKATKYWQSKIARLTKEDK